MSSFSSLPISNSQSLPSTSSLPLRSILTRLSTYARHALSNRRPWTELMDRTAFSRPFSISHASSRVRKNLAYFRVNYLIVLATMLAYFLLSHPFSILTLIALTAAWLFLYVLRPSDQPLVISGRTYSDAQVILGLSLASLIMILVSNVISLLLTAVMAGVGIVCGHGAFRDPEDLFLDDQEASSFLSIISGTASSGVTTSSGPTMVSRV